MATLQTNPSSVPDAVQEWTRELNISELGRVGYKNINYTLWNEASTAIPEVIEGSIIEINNSTYVELSDVAIDVTGDTDNAINWVIYEVSGSVATAYLKPTAPTASDYDVEKGGFYNGSGHRWTGDYMFVSPAGTAFSKKGYLDYANGAMLKYRIDDEADDFVIDSNLDVKKTLNVDGATTHVGTTTLQDNLITNGQILPSKQSENIWSIPSSTTLLIPKGMYTVTLVTGDAGTHLQGFFNSTWSTISRGSTIISDGINVRWNATTISATVRYIKF